MKKMNSEELRRSFLEYFRGLKHEIIDSSSVIPREDKTLLFTNAGMNQFKDVLLGIEKRDYKRAASCQMCVRAGGKHNDLDAVGRDGRHLTFFEMLGNWSFGDYWKEKAIEWSWNYVTKVLKMPIERLYVSVYKTDDESYNIWAKDIGIPKERIVRLGDVENGDEENFWSMGPTGPCGPCTEIYFDMGHELGCNKPGCFVGCNCDRYSEFWNIVFMEMNRLDDGIYIPLEFKSVDTGMGFERTVSILQGKVSVFDTDVFQPIINFVKKISKNEREHEKITRESYHVIADHIRTITFALAEGATFSNEGRGYVLRRILRRASRQGHLIGLKEPFLYSVVDIVIEKMGGIYPHIGSHKEIIKKEIRNEEEKFLNTLERGILYFDEAIKKSTMQNGRMISGEEVFRLHDTFGLPADLTEIMAREKGMQINWDEFNHYLEKQREQSRKSAKFYEVTDEDKAWIEIVGGEVTDFIGHEALHCKSRVRRYREYDDRLEFVFETSPFYLEMGGQRSDGGYLKVNDMRFRVIEVKKVGQYTVVVSEKFPVENISENLLVELFVDEIIRKKTCANHTTTHLLHNALKKTIDVSINQAGSSVDEEKLTFDFRYERALNSSELKHLEEVVNLNIVNNLEVKTHVMKLEEAIKQGAVALFGDKYENEVRVVDIGTGLSRELCGGTHANRTGDIGLFVIDSEKSIGNGIRRITAFTGPKALLYYNGIRETVNKIRDTLTSATNELPEKVLKIYTDNQKNTKEIVHLKKKLALHEIKDKGTEKQIDKLSLLSYIFEGYSRDELIEIASEILINKENMIAVFGSYSQDKTLLCMKTSDKLDINLNVGKLLGNICSHFGSKGGGRPNLATGNINKTITINDLIQSVEKEIISI
jgi:alanyl-tRNA synthetase